MTLKPAQRVKAGKVSDVTLSSHVIAGTLAASGLEAFLPRGVAASGYTEQQPTEDRYLLTRAELLDRIDVLLGGRVAEEIVFGDVSTGAADDLQRATDMARHMVTQYSMSETLGLGTFEESRQTFLGMGGP